jgi:hypothetical protein
MMSVNGEGAVGSSWITTERGVAPGTVVGIATTWPERVGFAVGTKVGKRVGSTITAVAYVVG